MAREIKYGFETREKFVTTIIKLREKGKTYQIIADALNKSGLRNRDGRHITAQFVGNILNRKPGQTKPKVVMKRKVKTASSVVSKARKAAKKVGKAVAKKVKPKNVAAKKVKKPKNVAAKKVKKTKKK